MIEATQTFSHGNTYLSPVVMIDEILTLNFENTVVVLNSTSLIVTLITERDGSHEER